MRKSKENLFLIMLLCVVGSSFVITDAFAVHDPDELLDEWKLTTEPKLEQISATEFRGTCTAGGTSPHDTPFKTNKILMGYVDEGASTVFADFRGIDNLQEETSSESVIEITMEFIENSDIALFCSTSDGGGAAISAYIFARDLTIEEVEEPKKKKSHCADCTPPTLGLDDNFKRIIDNGFSYNGEAKQVEFWHTPFPLITTSIDEMNKVDIVVYENSGINNMDMVQFGLGAEHVGQSLNDVEVLIQVPLFYNNTDKTINVDELIIHDKNNLIEHDTVLASSFITKCMNDVIKKQCVRVTLEYSYRESPLNNIMVVAASDSSRNTQYFYFNDGVSVEGVSLNKSPTYEMYNKHSPDQTDDITLTLTRIDKVNDIWEDKYGVEYNKVSEYRFNKMIPTR